jgi:hypothetical protein
MNSVNRIANTFPPDGNPGLIGPYDLHGSFSRKRMKSIP